MVTERRAPGSAAGWSVPAAISEPGDHDLGRGDLNWELQLQFFEKSATHASWRQFPQPGKLP